MPPPAGGDYDTGGGWGWNRPAGARGAIAAAGFRRVWPGPARVERADRKCAARRSARRAKVPRPKDRVTRRTRARLQGGRPVVRARLWGLLDGVKTRPRVGWATKGEVPGTPSIEKKNVEWNPQRA